MGSRGPIPKRTGQGHRTTVARKAKTVQTVRVGGGREVQIPAPDPEWHPIATMIWEAAAESGEAVFYEPSDWAVLYSVCDDVSHYKSRKQRSGQMLASINTMLTSLLLTEGDRRRVQIELERQPVEEATESEGVTSMREFLRSRGAG